MRISVIVPVLNQHWVAAVALDFARRNAVLADTEFVLLDNGSDMAFTPNSPGMIVDRKPKSIGVYPTFWWGKDIASGDVLAYLHSDLIVAEPGWDRRVLQEFEGSSRLGLLGFVGSNEIDHAGGRGLGTASNFLGGTYTDGVCDWTGSPAEVHGRRLTGTMQAAVVDGCAMIFRREALEEISQRPDFPPHHFYDRLLSCEVRERGYNVAVIGIGCDHISNQTAGTQEDYLRLAEQWCRSRGIAAGQAKNWDLAVYQEAERQFLDEYRERKRYIPIRVTNDVDEKPSHSASTITKIAIIMPVVNLWWRYTKPALDTIAVAAEQAANHGVWCRILLIDNASTDDTIREAGRTVSEEFSHKRNEERWSFARSVNYGVTDAWERSFDYSFIVNNDILLHPEAIWRLVLRMRQGDLGVATCLDVREETTPEFFLSMNAHTKISVAEAPHPNFSAFMISRPCWSSTGQFDEEFKPAYWEDNDYHYRMKLTGQVAITYPPALFYHFGSRTQHEAAENGAPMTPGRQFENLRTYYMAKWGGLPGREVYRVPFNRSDNVAGL
jgi:GT2 family glycosyltransferase